MTTEVHAYFQACEKGETVNDLSDMDMDQEDTIEIYVEVETKAGE